MLLSLAGDTAVFQCFIDTAIDFCKLLRGKKGAVGDKAGAGGESLLCCGVAICATARSIVGASIQAGALPHPLPGNELHPIPSRMTRQNHIIEFRQKPVVSRQSAGRQLGRRLHLPHILCGGFGDRNCPVQCGAPVVICRVLLPVSHRAGVQREAEALSVQLHRQEALLCFRFHNEALVLEIEGKLLKIPAFCFCVHFDPPHFLM